MKTKQILVMSLVSIAMAAGLRADAPAKVIAISASDTMKFSVTKIEAQPGQKIVVEFTNDGNIPKEAMGHNWILLKAGVDPVAYANQAMTAKAENYQPSALANEVIASCPLLGPKETRKIAFTAPSAPGSYSYLCSFPGHCGGGMRGVLIVK